MKALPLLTLPLLLPLAASGVRASSPSPAAAPVPPLVLRETAHHLVEDFQTDLRSHPHASADQRQLLAVCQEIENRTTALQHATDLWTSSRLLHQDVEFARLLARRASACACVQTHLATLDVQLYAFEMQLQNRAPQLASRPTPAPHRDEEAAHRIESTERTLNTVGAIAGLVLRLIDAHHQRR
ncbi:MAG: hypothetical protein KDK99_12075 [Verrucomicrobiales bacterium]|nr:hypothetical protein [Verrucomicrobiales bacterium]